MSDNTREIDARVGASPLPAPGLLACPFCGDVTYGGYDLIGLKSHLEHGDCDAYNNVENVPRLRW